MIVQVGVRGEGESEIFEIVPVLVARSRQPGPPTRRRKEIASNDRQGGLSHFEVSLRRSMSIDILDLLRPAAFVPAKGLLATVLGDPLKTRFGYGQSTCSFQNSSEYGSRLCRSLSR